ncbi:NAD(P)-binding protein [Epithele typhae]|uniref:NAD(P)-binding protein n=1 Tax=Epithele typhae TaxID=378194 RepID=UPI002007E603|nr:NAD(P)-binding protein [Epithele typhae]KAH9914493.1 NAD(P)-binding protein [Epithele typhae]
MSASKTPVLFLGATGYVGGTFLSRVLADPELLPKLDLTLYVRSADKAKRLEEDFPGVKTAIGTLAELDKLEQLSEQAHVVINFANADDVEMAKAILGGMKTRHAKLGTAPSSCTPRKLGNLITDDIYSDLDVDKLDTIPAEALHRPVDLLFLEADKEGYMRAFSRKGSCEEGLTNTHSLQVPALIRDALIRKRVGIIGEGQGIWDNVHVEDLASLYAIILRRLVSSPASITHGRDGYFFAENGEHLWLDLSRRVAEALFALGAIESAELVKFETEESIGEFAKHEAYVFANGTNARSRADRARSQLGWAPTRTVEDLWASIKPEAEALIAGRARTRLAQPGWRRAEPVGRFGM